MALPNLTVRRICLHEVYRRREDGQSLPVTYGPGLLQLDVEAMEAFVSRIHAAFKSDAKCMEMSIARHEAGSVAERGVSLIAANDREFVSQSRVFADLLAQHQHSRSIPGGLLVMFDGTVGNPETQFFAAMKAELHSGFLRGNDLTATFVKSLFLSPTNKLYKIGLFRASASPAEAMPGGWTATLYDRQLSAVDRDGAAGYFHSSFLGLAIPENSAHQVRKFFEHTRDFIRTSDMSEEDKVDLYNSLYTYLKVDQSPDIQTGTFADTYMNADLGERYREHMNRERFPEAAIPKDLSEVRGRLKRRRFRFPGSIILSGPSEAMSSMVDVEAIEGEDGDQWTQITVHGPLEGQD